MLYENTLTELIIRMLKVPLQDYKGGTADSAGAVGKTTLVDSARDEPDSYFNNTTPQSRIRITSTTDGAAPVGEERKITGFANSGGTLTFAALTAATAAGDKYVILSEYSWAELAEAINMVIDSLAEKALLYKIDETIELQDDTYEYVIPAGFVTIHRLAQEDDNGDYLDPIPPQHYRIIAGEMPRIHFYRYPVEMQFADHYYGTLWVESDLVDGRHLRIEGYGRQERLETDNSVCYLNPNYIVYKAAAYVLGARVTSADHDAYKVRRDEANAEAEALLKGLLITQALPDSKKVHK